jgi:putative phage-type endonuclease
LQRMVYKVKIVKSLNQNTPDWHAWRSRGLGASEAPIIMGDSPWNTPFQLWLEKTGQMKREEPNGFAAAAMQRGVRMEPEARAWYEQNQAVLMQPLSAEHDVHSYIRASLDGANTAIKVGIEIKCPGKLGHEKTKASKELPSHYKAQVQQQLMVTGFDRIDFVSYDGQDNVIIPVYPDIPYQAVLYSKLAKFWECVEFQISPEILERDNWIVLARHQKAVDSLNQSAKMIEMLFNVKKTNKKEKR